MQQLQWRRTPQSRWRWLDLSTCHGNSRSPSTPQAVVSYLLHQHCRLSSTYQWHDLLTTVATVVLPWLQTSILQGTRRQWNVLSPASKSNHKQFIKYNKLTNYTHTFCFNWPFFSRILSGYQVLISYKSRFKCVLFWYPISWYAVLSTLKAVFWLVK